MKKVLKEIRWKIQVEPGSPEEILLRFLKEASNTRYSRLEMVMLAIQICWLPLAYKHASKSDVEISKALQDMEYRWQIHHRYLRDMLGIPVNQETSTTSQSNGIADIEITQSLEDDTEVESINGINSSFDSYNPFGHGIVS